MPGPFLNCFSLLPPFSLAPHPEIASGPIDSTSLRSLQTAFFPQCCFHHLGQSQRTSHRENEQGQFDITTWQRSTQTPFPPHGRLDPGKCSHSSLFFPSIAFITTRNFLFISGAVFVCPLDQKTEESETLFCSSLFILNDEQCLLYSSYQIKIIGWMDG